MKYILSFEIETNEGITYQMFEELAHDITNNNIKNLKWSNDKQNMVYVSEWHPGFNIAENGTNSTISNELALKIYNLLWFEKLSYQEVESRYGVPTHTQRNIKYGNSWVTVTHHVKGKKPKESKT